MVKGTRRTKRRKGGKEGGRDRGESVIRLGKIN